MINVIVGQNAAGKTLFLSNKCVNCTSLVTNLSGYDCSYDTFREDRLHILENFTTGDVTVERDVVRVTGGWFAFSMEMLRYVSLLCRDGDRLVLDEPDLYVTDEDEVTLLYNLIKELGNSFKESYVATHRGNLVHYSGADIFTVENGILVPIDRGVVYENLL